MSLNNSLNNIKALLTLQNVPNLGDSSIKKLIQTVGNAEAVLSEKKSNLLKIPGIGAIKIKSIHNKIHQSAADEELKFIKKNNITISPYTDPNYPKRLKQCIDSPILLFSTGKIILDNRPVISIVGTRKITRYGIHFCEELIENLKPFNPIIVSGYAYGVDITAHKAAIKNNLQTIACLGHGLNQIYPKNHKQYMTSMENNGGFYTDFWSTDKFTPQNFLKRNRIIAGISQATIVIESAEKGGSLATAQMANSYFRDVFAVPGRINDTYSKGCNMLIKSQQAHMLTSVADLVYILNWKQEKENQTAIQKSLFIDLLPNEQSIYDVLLKEGKKDLDSIALTCNIPTYQVASILVKLELEGIVQPLPGKMFQII